MPKETGNIKHILISECTFPPRFKHVRIILIHRPSFHNVLNISPMLLPKARTYGGLRMSDNRVLRRIPKPKMEEVTGGRRKSHNEESHTLYFS
jgi:hypothetical protein